VGGQRAKMLRPVLGQPLSFSELPFYFP